MKFVEVSKMKTLFVTRKWFYYVKELFLYVCPVILLIEVCTYFFTGETTGNLRISDAYALITCHQLFEFTKYIVDPKSRNALRYLTMYIQIGKKRFPSTKGFLFINFE